ncbi:sugar phosphate isomerase/epimerase [Klenkia sp. LSe6-5]|uniref:Sugar phosphate isomerase/epimerase n=1 Tax=Klenkia sesuvii TaxID=3103137 RepID=A0ABU8DTW9_9ACTN
MKLAFSNLAWPAERDTAVLAELPRRGFDHLEIAPTRIWSDPLAVPEQELRAFRSQMEDHGLHVVALQSLLFGRPELQLFGDDDARAALADHLVGMARLASAVGAQRLVFGSPGNRRRGALPVEEADAVAVPFFAELGRRAEDLGVCFCIEANPTAYKCDYLTDAVASTAFVRAVDSSGVRLHLDTACMALGGDDPVERVEDGVDVLAHVHLSAPQLGPVGPGGPVDHASFAEALRGSGYDGHVSVEMLVPSGDDPEATLWRTADYVKETYA